MEKLVAHFQFEVRGAKEECFHSCVRSFLNLWSYEYGSFDHLPDEIHHLLHFSPYDIITDDSE